MNIDKLFPLQGFIETKGDQNHYIKKDEKGHIVLIYVYVDYLIITRSATKVIEKI